MGRSSDLKVIPVLKLHGSANWSDAAADASKQATKRRYFRSYEDLHQSRAKPRIVPPTWSKGRDEIISDQWKEALSRLRSATRIVVLGFSMPETDLHFRYLLSAGLQENIWLRSMLFINPRADELKARAGQILNQRYIEEELIRFLSFGAETFAARVAQRPSFPSNQGNIDIDIGRSVPADLICNVYDDRQPG